MATIYQKPQADQTVVLEPREAFVLPFSSVLSGDYNTLKLGMYISLTNTIGFNSESLDVDPGDQDINPMIGNMDRILFGLVNKTGYFPGSGNCAFVGYTTNDNYGGRNYTYMGQNSTRQIRLNATDYYGNDKHGSLAMIDSTGYYNESGTNENINVHAPDDGATNSQFCAYYGIRYIFNKTGQSGQNVVLSKDNNWNLTESGLNQLDMQNMNATSNDVSYSFTSGDNNKYPLDLPIAAFIYLPYTGLRLRIHAIGVYKIR